MSKNYHGIAERYAMIINELSKNEIVSSKRLVEITGSDIRTIQRDLNERLKSVFEIEKVENKRGYYSMNRKYRGLFTINEFKHLATLTGIADVFPDLDEKFVKDLLENRINKTFSVKLPGQDNIRTYKDEFEIVSKAIEEKRVLRFKYKNKTYEVEPYQLVNMKGNWYLCCTHEGKIKTFRLSQMIKLNIRSLTFPINLEIMEEIHNSDTIWMANSKPTYIKLSISSDFSEYFTETIVLPGQQKVEEHDDGRLIVTLEARFLDEIKGIIKYWIPRIKVLEPDYLQKELDRELLEYINC